MYGNFDSLLIFNTAMSEFLSVPISSASYDLLSLVVISISVAFSITWLLVMMKPSLETITPDPVPTVVLSFEFP